MERKAFPPSPISARPVFPRGEPGLAAIPVRRQVYPTVGKAAPIGGEIGQGPSTPLPLLRDTIASFEVGQITLPFFSLAEAGQLQWTRYVADRPTILQSMTVEQEGIFGTSAPNAGPIIHYNYGKVPAGASFPAQVSERTGTCFLSNPGVWYLLNGMDPESDGVDIDLRVIDASHPEVAARFLRQPGVNVENQFNTTIDDETVAVAIPTGGRWTRAVTIQNVPTLAGNSAPLRFSVCWSDDYLNTAGAWTGRGFRLTENGSATFAKDWLARGIIYVSLEAAGETALECVQYRDL